MSKNLAHASSSPGQPGVELVGSPGVLWRYLQADRRTIDVAPPTVEIDGRVSVFTGSPQEIARTALANGAIEHVIQCPVDDEDDLRLRLIVRVAPITPWSGSATSCGARPSVD